MYHVLGIELANGHRISSRHLGGVVGLSFGGLCLGV